MSTYELYLLAHVAAVVVWVGATFLMALLGARMSVADDVGRRLGYAQDAEWLGLRLFLPSSMLALVSGMLLVHEGKWGYGPLWIQLGIVALALSTVLGVAVFGPGWKRVGTLAAEHGLESPEARARLGTLLLFGWVDLGLLAGALFAMLIRPEADDAGALVVTGLILAAAIAIGLASGRRSRARDGAVLVGSPAEAGGQAGTGARG